MIQLPMFEPESNWTPPEIFPEWHGAKQIAIDTETDDPYLEETGAGWATRKGKVVGISTAWEEGNNIVKSYFPIAHESGGNMDRKMVLKYIDCILKSQIPKIFHNSIYDLGWLSTEGLDTVEGEIFDTQFGAALLDEDRMSYSLDNIAKDWVGQQKDETLLREAGASWGFKTPKAVKKNLWRIHPRFVGPYAEEDAAILLPLYKYEKEKLAQDKLLGISDLEHSLIPMLIAMRKRGIRVDIDKAVQVRENLKKQRVEILEEINRKFGVRVDVWSADSLAKAFDAQSLTYPRTVKTNKPSFQKEFLEGHQHEMPRAIRQVRKIENTINTMIEGQILKHNTKGRIHHELHPLKSDIGGTVSGRFSCSNPNLQQSSGRDEVYAPMVRGIFLPEQGQRWGALDYSSQEPRLTLHYAALTNQAGAKEAVTRYKSNPRTDYHQMVADLCQISRKHAKTINLGLAYGMGELKLCYSLGLPTEMVSSKWGDGEFEVAGPEGKAIIAAYHVNAPFIRGMMDFTSTQAARRGWIRTIGGRLCRFEQWEPTKWQANAQRANTMEEAKKKWPNQGVRRAFTHKAMNKLIQGSAADMTKIAMRNMWQEGIIPLHQMHDELDISVESEKEYKKVEEIMINAVPLEVPIVVDCEFGKSWGDAVHSWENIDA